MPTAAERLSSIRLKLDRAIKHRSELEATLRRFIATNPLAIERRREGRDGAYSSYYATHVAAIPDEISMIAGDALHCARTALDHLACQLVSAAGGTVTGQTKFPVAENETKYANAFDSATRGMSPAAIKAIDAMRPYGIQDTAMGPRFMLFFDGAPIGPKLWLLHKLDIIDKHRLILAVGSAVSAVEPGWMETPSLETLVVPMTPSCPLKVGDCVHENFVPDAQLKREPQIGFDVALGEEAVGVPLLGLVRLLHEATEEVVRVLTPHLN